MSATLTKRAALLVALLFAALIATLAPAAQAQASTHDAGFYAVSGSAPIYMCKDWQKSPGDGRNEKGTCKPSSSKRAIYAGQRTTTTLGWGDTDGFWLPSGYKIALKPGGSAFYAVRYSSWGWRKVYGCNGCIYDLKKYVP